MKKYIATLLFIAAVFGIFVPYGYLAWYWAVPISIISFLNATGIAMQFNKDNT